MLMLLSGTVELRFISRLLFTIIAWAVPRPWRWRWGRLARWLARVACMRVWVVPRPWSWRWRRLARWSHAPRRWSRTGCWLVGGLERGPLPLRLPQAQWRLGSMAGRLAAAGSDALARAPRIGVIRRRWSLVVLPGVGPDRGRTPAHRPNLLLAQLRPRSRPSPSWVPSWRRWCSRVLPTSWRPRLHCAGGSWPLPRGREPPFLSLKLARRSPPMSLERRTTSQSTGTGRQISSSCAAAAVSGMRWWPRGSWMAKAFLCASHRGVVSFRQSGKTSGLGCISSSPEFQHMPSINRRRLLFLAQRRGWKGWVLRLLAGKIWAGFR
jgi:hypothetical protein